MNLTCRRMDAMRSHASAEAMVASQSLARQRHRPSQAKGLSTTHRRTMTTKPFASSGRLTISMRGAFAFSRVPWQFLAGIAAIGEQMSERGKALTGRGDERRRAVPVLNTGFVHDGRQQVALRVGHDMALCGP